MCTSEPFPQTTWREYLTWIFLSQRLFLTSDSGKKIAPTSEELQRKTCNRKNLSCRWSGLSCRQQNMSEFRTSLI